MIKIEVELDSEAHSLLEKLAKRVDMTASSLVNQIVEAYVQAAAVQERRRRILRHDTRGKHDPKGGRNRSRAKLKLPLVRFFSEQNHKE